MPVVTTTVQPSKVAVAAGDSLTAKIWYQGGDGVNFSPRDTGLQDTVNNRWSRVRNGIQSSGAARQIARQASPSVRHATSLTSKDTRLNLTWINSGLSGDGVVNLNTNVATRITQYAPDYLFLFIGINDGVGDGTGMVGPTAPATFSTAYQSIITATLAAKSTCQIVCMTPLSAGEKWAVVNSVPVYSGNVGAHDADIDAICAVVRTLAASNNCNLIDLRALGGVYQSVFNAGNADSGILTKLTDGRHLTTDGAVWVGQQVRAQLTLLSA